MFIIGRSMSSLTYVLTQYVCVHGCVSVVCTERVKMIDSHGCLVFIQTGSEQVCPRRVPAQSTADHQWWAGQDHV